MFQSWWWKIIQEKRKVDDQVCWEMKSRRWILDDEDWMIKPRRLRVNDEEGMMGSEWWRVVLETRWLRLYESGWWRIEDRELRMMLNFCSRMDDWDSSRHRCSKCSKRSLSFLKKTHSFTLISILFLANVSERQLFHLSFFFANSFGLNY